MKYHAMVKLIGFASAAENQPWDYKVNGANWPSLINIPNNNCDGG